MFYFACKKPLNRCLLARLHKPFPVCNVCTTGWSNLFAALTPCPENPPLIPHFPGAFEMPLIMKMLLPFITLQPE
jgi:hypothetical protein